MRRSLALRSLAAPILAAALAPVSFSQEPSSEARREFVGFDDLVSCAAIQSGVLYVGGGFDRAGPVVGSCAILDPLTAAPDPTAPILPGETQAIVPDGEGGWYIGGVLGTAGSSSDPKIRHLLADGTFDPWSPAIDGGVAAIELTADRIYIAGQFGVVAGQTRRKLAAFDRATGQLLPWNPSPANWTSGSEFVTDLRASGDSVYVAGHFEEVPFGGQERSHLVALSATTGLPLPWDPEPDAAVWALESTEAGLVVGGNFTAIGALPRNRLALLDPLTGAAQAWNPNANSTVLALDRSGDTLYLGGIFAQVGGIPRSRLAAVSLESGAVLPWSPQVSPAGGGGAEVNALAVHGSSVFVAGDFAAVGGAPRRSAAAISAETGSVLPWACDLVGASGGLARTVAAAGNQVLFGGDFRIIATPRAGVAAIDIASGALLPWNPVLPAAANVNAIIATPSAIYLGGDFTTVNGLPRPDLAAVDAATGATISGFQPSFQASSSSVSALVLREGILHLGGVFQLAGGGQNFAAVSAATGAPAPGWTTSASGSVRTIALSPDGSTLFIGGSFDQVGQGGVFVLRSRLAAFDAATGSPTDWAPAVVGTVESLASSGADLIVGGAFVSVNGEPRQNLAKVDAGGAVLPWSPEVEGAGSTSVETLLPLGDSVIAGGRFETIGAAYRPRVARIGLADGVPGAWSPVPSPGEVYGLAAGSSVLAIAGSFGLVGGTPRPFLAVFDLDLGEYQFVRGDGNDDGLVDLGDAISGLLYLFAGGSAPCLAAHDANADGAVDCADPISILVHLFTAGPPPPPPFPECGAPPPGTSLGCIGSRCP